jgi:hypothetical protein
MSATGERKRRSIPRDRSDGWLLPGKNDRRRGELLASALVTSPLHARVDRGDTMFVRVEVDHLRTTDSFEMGRA